MVEKNTPPAPWKDAPDIHVAKVKFKRTKNSEWESGTAFVEAPGLHSVMAIATKDHEVFKEEPYDFELDFYAKITVQSGTATFEMNDD